MAECTVFDPGELIDRFLDRQRLDQYYSLLMEHNRKVNLVSRETSRADFDRLVAESLLVLEQISIPVQDYLDIGSGGGIPAIPILMAGAVSGQAILVERTVKKARALESLVRGLELAGTVLPRNFEELHNLPALDLITLRLVKMDRLLLSGIRAALAPGGRLVYFGKPDFKVEALSYRTAEYRSSQVTVIKNLTILQK